MVSPSNFVRRLSIKKSYYQIFVCVLHIVLWNAWDVSTRCYIFLVYMHGIDRTRLNEGVAKIQFRSARNVIMGNCARHYDVIIISAQHLCVRHVTWRTENECVIFTCKDVARDNEPWSIGQIHFRVIEYAAFYIPQSNHQQSAMVVSRNNNIASWVIGRLRAALEELRGHVPYKYIDIDGGGGGTGQVP